MAFETADTIDRLLVGVQEGIDDPDASFKLRTARQLLVLLDEQHEAGLVALAEADLDEDSRENLRQLGYLE